MDDYIGLTGIEVLCEEVVVVLADGVEEPSRIDRRVSQTN